MNKKMRDLINQLEDNNQSWEFYPTTKPMIERIYQDLIDYNANYSILDIGCGNGNFFTKFAEIGDKVQITRKLAIEKSEILINQLPADVCIVGTDFWENTLIDKKVNVVFSNPPYSEFEEWAEKIILEANCKKIYLVIPERWKNSDRIANALKLRDATASNLGSFDFLDAERAARAKVEIVKIKINEYGNGKDPFNVWFNQNFQFEKAEEFGHKERDQAIENELETGQNLIEILANLYLKEFQKLMGNYQAICSLDASILKEIKVDVWKIKNGLEEKIKGLKYTYWKRLFDGLGSLTNKLTSKSRKRMLDKIFDNSTIDFTTSNAYAVVIWAIKNANLYFNEQLKEIYKDLTETDCVKKYKSNQRTWEKERWKYKENSHYCLDYRVITYAGTKSGTYGTDYQQLLISDVGVIASNLGFNYIGDIKTFGNGNVHFRFEKEFIKAFNIEAARLFGWIKSSQEASEEFPEDCKVSESEAKKYFKSNFVLLNNAQQLLLTN